MQGKSMEPQTKCVQLSSIASSFHIVPFLISPMLAVHIGSLNSSHFVVILFLHTVICCVVPTIICQGRGAGGGAPYCKLYDVHNFVCLFQKAKVKRVLLTLRFI